MRKIGNIVYVIGRASKNPPFKLGATYDVGLRVVRLSQQLKEPVTIYRQFECGASEPYPLEGWLRRHCYQFPRMGEWYNVELDQLLAVIDDAMKTWPDQIGKFKALPPVKTESALT